MTQRIDPQDEILAAACKALDKAHFLLSAIVKYKEQALTPQFLAKANDWIDGEYDPGSKNPKKCVHVPMRSKLGDVIGCIRCGISMGHVD